MWTVPRSELSAAEALQQLARRYLHVFGPSTLESFARWSGINEAPAMETFDALAQTLLTVRTPIGEGRVLAEDLPTLQERPIPTDAVRLLPSGDPYFLLWGADRQLLVPDAAHRAKLWTSRVWPGAVLVDGELVGTWRRSQAVVTVEPWRHLDLAERQAVEAEAATLPLPGVGAAASVHWAK